MADLGKLRGGHFVIIGRAGMDFYPDPPGTKTEEAVNFFACLGGSSANIGVAINKHGGRTALVTSVSDDAIGRFCLNQLDHYGIDRTHVRSVAGEFRNSLAAVDSRMEDHQSVIYRNGAADFEMTQGDVAGVDFSTYEPSLQPNRPAMRRFMGLIWPKRWDCPAFLTWITAPTVGPRPRMRHKPIPARLNIATSLSATM